MYLALFGQFILDRLSASLHPPDSFARSSVVASVWHNVEFPVVSEMSSKSGHDHVLPKNTSYPALYLFNHRSQVLLFFSFFCHHLDQVPASLFPTWVLSRHKEGLHHFPHSQCLQSGGESSGGLARPAFILSSSSWLSLGEEGSLS